jgi:hypothetical protein
MAQDNDDKISDRLAEAFWVMLRMGVAGSGRRGAEIAKAAGVPESSLRKMAAKGMVPTVAQYNDILKALQDRGVKLDVTKLTVKLDAVPKHRPTKDKPKQRKVD